MIKNKRGLVLTGQKGKRRWRRGARSEPDNIRMSTYENFPGIRVSGQAHTMMRQRVGQYGKVGGAIGGIGGGLLSYKTFNRARPSILNIPSNYVGVDPKIGRTVMGAVGGYIAGDLLGRGVGAITNIRQLQDIQRDSEKEGQPLSFYSQQEKKQIRRGGTTQYLREREDKTLSSLDRLDKYFGPDVPDYKKGSKKYRQSTRMLINKENERIHKGLYR